MTVASLVIWGPLAALVLILLMRQWAGSLALAGSAVAVACAIITLVRVASGARFEAELPALPAYPLRLDVTPTSAILAVTVASVSFLVLVYSMGYMGRERDRTRFYSQMLFFSTAMEALVLAGDWVLFLAAWELIGLASYLLIGYWYDRQGVPRAATRAFLTTRTADLGLYLGIFALVAHSGTTEISRTLGAGGWVAVVASLLILVAAMGKSTQLPFQGWLQDAMLGPTPVSALLHSATLVAAGAILLARVYPLLPLGLLLVVGAVGGVTAVVTGVMAMAQRDLKRMLAASTSSQLGFMFLAVGAGSPVAAIAHLVVHASMKSVLFGASGVYQHARGSTRFEDLRGGGRQHPRVFVGFVLAGLALAGIPPLAGFWSKDAVEAAALGSPSVWLLGPLALVATLLTGVYVARAIRLLWYVPAGTEGENAEVAPYIGRGQPGQARRPAPMGVSQDAGPGNRWASTDVLRDRGIRRLAELLWRGERGGEPLPGIRWMGLGLAALVFFAVVLGVAVVPIGDVIGQRIPESGVALGLGLLASVLGLVVGWLLPTRSMLGTAREAAETGFRVGDGFVQLVVDPAMTLATISNRFDNSIHRLVLGIGHAGLSIAQATTRLDDRGIDGAIGALVENTRGMGARARRLQTGLVSRELLFATVGALLLLALILIIK